MASLTIIDIAKICGVGVTTVSRAINNHPDISDETKAMIMKVVKENNYVPNNNARNLKRTASKTIAVLIKGMNNPFFIQMIDLFEKGIKDKKYTFILHRVYEHQDEIDVANELVKEKKLKGIIFLGGYLSHSQDKLEQLTVPYVLCTVGLSSEFDTYNYSYVSIDDFAESYKMVDYLCSQGHKRIALISASMEDRSIGQLRYQGYKQALEDHGITIDEQLVRPMKAHLESYSIENGYVVTKEMLAENLDFSALFAISDSMAVGASKALLEAGRSIPEDCSVAGFDGLDMSFYYHPSITTIEQPIAKMAEETIKIMFDLINKKVTHTQLKFPAELIVRDSTGVIHS
ncbi:LacI family DNA-binding transcriptional regulator [Paenibacillus endoradicis]|uniref:LacI family DNA-binding transcriptional regulator n=1 Tax=Paenibacillus endoradicis TaxID=2972487 RepID=UPI0021591665|nr:LacI family DNA-binding transcriptional regulator [Paenibacillus endoradicis]MCR8657416.1 LacI family transcriptional regulator [Paenibacillus endoradicis]